MTKATTHPTLGGVQYNEILLAYDMQVSFNICHAVQFQYMPCGWISMYAMLLDFNI